MEDSLEHRGGSLSVSKRNGSSDLGLPCNSTTRAFVRICDWVIDLPQLLGHVTPEAHLGGPLALVEDGDKITIDANKRTIDWHVSEEVRAARQTAFISRGPRSFTVRRGVLLRYARDVAVSVFVCSLLGKFDDT
jgi:hypothetical protein